MFCTLVVAKVHWFLFGLTQTNFTQPHRSVRLSYEKSSLVFGSWGWNPVKLSLKAGQPCNSSTTKSRILFIKTSVTVGAPLGRMRHLTVTGSSTSSDRDLSKQNSAFCCRTSALQLVYWQGSGGSWEQTDRAEKLSQNFFVYWHLFLRIIFFE